MEFGWSPRHEAYREEVRAALKDLLPADWRENYARYGMGSPEQIEFSRSFCPELAKRGLLLPHWPKAYGGRDGDPWEQFILAEEMKLAGEPRGPQYMNVNWIGPVLMKYGTPAQQAEHLTRIAAGTVIWCQCYSEPGAGTDLAALVTRAERVGDTYVINGSKIWTSYSRKADWCFLLARTGPERKAISIFLLPMDTPGIEVKPFPGLVEDGHLNEVFFTNVQIPVESRLGEESRAWDIITYALSFERVGIPRYNQGLKLLNLIMERLEGEGRAGDLVIRSRAGQIASKFEAARLLTYVVVDQRAKDRPPSIDANVSRVTAAEACLDLLDFIAEYAPDSMTEVGVDELRGFYRGNISSTIAAGTYEIQLNMIARQALGLPRGD
ncbi:putative acyl-CoA dehydrogenase yngJ [Hyphomonas polymorpha PS728]|uniref:Putative acyl-CoA dehydrogenase yngJ n=1 Tax=Hyphomonas polymorpha PS728 TaxID=1280954 RepID=A0A062VDU5_9PROT|nr:acyl-CoA dehydrogenase family protein [Hyphomonas polymorpha]KCZ96639.1 putative acyl-CoA dehydrogenase yngJ [Hyphomonas polymorpha PS728]